ncbi:unnamed protein product [Parascedosporium putredinis]|uniref:Glucanase n=1 Tax=Parascedosporium putredinis TaxID=1442378 RepID=A0A9P1H931_9PEZI|nr:unnamed protein product [Parascedosporium putredinis]CAI7999969.1 unnamed protein product [Parascedosporium putredinis]
MRRAAVLSAFVAAVAAQSAGTETAETHPKMSWSKCSEGGSCTKVNGEVVLDSNWRWTHEVGGYENCYDGNIWTDLCSSPEECGTKCAIEGADYAGTYGASTSGDALTLKFVTEHEYGANIGSRLYLMETEDKYQMFTLLGNEFTFDVDMSKVGCGLNGALYFVSMDADGGLAKSPNNKAGAKYGTGYCDAQCPRDLKYIDGKGNIIGWNPSDNDQNAGQQNLHRLHPHPCTTVGQHTCTGDSCGGTYSDDRYGGTCDPDGCDFNSYRQGDLEFYGPGMTVDTNKVFTVVTQFIEEAGQLSAIRRFYVQDGKVIANSESLIEGNPGNEINDEFCKAQKKAFGDGDVFNDKGGFPQFTEAVAGGMVLVMSLWDDHYSNMLWLDSTFPTDAAASEPGKARGSCPTDSGVPEEVEASQASDQIIFSNIKFGPVGSTFDQP